LGVRGEVGIPRSEYRDIVKTLSSVFRIESLSSLYVGAHDIRAQRRILQCVSFCILADSGRTTLEDAPAFLEGLRVELQKSALKPHWKEVLILDWEGQVRIDPSLVLPHPEWHRKRYWLLPAAEIAGDLIHPVLQVHLREILAESTEDETEGVKFLDQSRGLLDFQEQRT
jgi:hypothetical protein